MARVHHARPQQQQGVSRAMALDKTRAAAKKKKPYKIVLEAVTQEKKKLHSILTYASNAPKGFGFVPAGHPEITEWCKEQCRQRNLDVHVVSAKPKNKTHADPEKLSHHVHRIGHHFPLEIIKLACSKFGYVYDEESGLRKVRVRDRENWIEQQVESYSTRQALHGGPATKEGSKDHITGAVREMFPKIPEADLSSIVNHAFEEGTNRVGNAKELSLARRVQLAVVAHIRHTYTDYDKMLKTGSWTEARQKVEHVSLAKLKEWRDETGEQSNEIEDTFREVIVLDDDDDDDDSSDGGNTPDEREQSMEITSDRVMARDIQLERYPQYPLANDYQRRRGHGRTIVVHPYPPSSVAHLPQAMRSGQAYDELARQGPYPKDSPLPSDLPSMRAPAQPEPRRAPNYMRDSDGRVYELLPINETPRVKYRTAAPHYIQQGHSYPSSRVDAQSSRAPPPPPRRTSDQEVVLPSVERETIDLISPPRTVKDQRAAQDRNGAPQEYSHVQSLKRNAYPPPTESGDRYLEQPSKRSRASLHEQELYTGSGSRQAAMYPQNRGHPPLETRPPRNAYPSHEVIDLTSSLRQPPFGTTGDLPASGRNYATAGPSNHAYLPEVQRRPTARNDYKDQPTGAHPHSYAPEHARMYQRRPPPAHEYIPLRR